MKTSGYDCVTIPGAVKNSADMKAVEERICGRKFVTMNEAMASTTICSKTSTFKELTSPTIHSGRKCQLCGHPIYIKSV